MPLPPSNAPRTLTHSRRASFEGFRRADGLWDIEAHMVDVKPQDYFLSSGTRHTGTPVHDMRVRITIDRQFNVLAAEVAIDGAPYDGHCSAIAPDYAKLVGLNLMHGFRKALRDRLGGALGCSHLSELVAQLPTIAMQTFAGEVRDNEDRGHKPFQLDRCHALETHGEAVRRYYPRWYRAVRTGSE
jgi:hypothetical protein